MAITTNQTIINSGLIAGLRNTSDSYSFNTLIKLGFAIK